MENINNSKGDVDRKPDTFNKPANNYVAQLRENVLHNSVSKRIFAAVAVAKFPFSAYQQLPKYKPWTRCSNVFWW